MNKKRNWSKNTRQRIALEYYRRVFGKSAESYAEIPEADKYILKRIPLQQAVSFVCADDKAQGRTYQQIGIKYDFTERQAKTYVATYRNSRFVED